MRARIGAPIGTSASGWQVAAAVMIVVCAGVAIAAAQDRPAGASLAGTWRLDPTLSDHPEQVALALRIDTGEVRPEDLFGSAGAPAPSGRGGRGRGGQPREEPREEPSENIRKIRTELTESIRVPPLTLTIALDETVTITAGAKMPDVLRPNGKAEKYELTAGTIERTAKREGPNLIVEYNADDAGVLTYTYGLAPTTGQLVVRIAVGRRRDEPGPFVIKIVYNRAAPAGAGA